jgi:hypothetical protein
VVEELKRETGVKMMDYLAVALDDRAIGMAGLATPYLALPGGSEAVSFFGGTENPRLRVPRADLPALEAHGQVTRLVEPWPARPGDEAAWIRSDVFAQIRKHPLPGPFGGWFDADRPTEWISEDGSLRRRPIPGLTRGHLTSDAEVFFGRPELLRAFRASCYAGLLGEADREIGVALATPDVSLGYRTQAAESSERSARRALAFAPNRAAPEALAVWVRVAFLWRWRGLHAQVPRVYTLSVRPAFRLSPEAFEQQIAAYEATLRAPKECF